MKSIRNSVTRLWVLVAVIGCLPAATDAAQLTNSWTGLISGQRWDSGSLWSQGVTPSTNQSVIMISNGFGPLSPIVKTVVVDNVTITNGASLTISNLVVSAPMTSNGMQIVQGLNVLAMSNIGATPFRILSALTISNGGIISISNSTLRADGVGTFVVLYDDGDINLNGGSLIWSNKTMEMGVAGQGALTISNGLVLSGASEIGENAGTQGTLNMAGGTNVSDGYMFVGYAGGATGALWLTGGRLVITNAITRIGNDGIGQMSISNGTWLARDVIVGFTTGARGTLTVAGGTVAMVGPFNIAGGPSSSGGGTGVVFVSGGGLVVTNTPANVTSASGEFIIDGTVVLTNGGTLVATNSSTFIGNNGSGILTNFGGTLTLRGLSVGTLAGSQGTMTMLGGTTTVQESFGVGDNNNSTGTVWMSGGQYNGPMTVGVSGIGRVTMSNGVMNATTLVVGLSNKGTFTMAGGTNAAGDLNIGFSSATGQVWMTGGRLGGVGTDYTIGVGDVGVLTLSNGLALGRTMEVGFAVGSQGTLTVNGGTLALSGPLTIGGAGSTGFVQVTGGQLVLTNDVSGVGAGGTGLVVDSSLVISNGGTLTVGSLSAIIGNVGDGVLSNIGGSFTGTNIVVGNFSGSHGTINMSGGTIGTDGTLTLGSGAGSSGALWISGGDLQLDLSVASRINIGGAGSGALILSNGTMEALQVLLGFSPGSSGTLTVAGGTYTSGSTMTIGYTSTGAVWVTGGVLAETNPFRTAGIFTGDGPGLITVSNGLFMADELYLGTFDPLGRGTLTAAGGTTLITTNLVLGQANCGGGNGTVVVAGGGVFVTNAAGSAVLEVREGTLEIDSGTLVVDHLVITNPCASFIRNGGTLILHSPPTLLPGADTDGDGIPNGYEQSHGLDPLDPVNATKDSDGDGMTDLQEYLAGTDPTNSASTFRITSISQVGSDVLVVWMMGPGKTNALQVTSGAGDGSYTTNGFATLFTVTNTVGTTTNYLDVGGATNGPTRYYRVRLVP